MNTLLIFDWNRTLYNPDTDDLEVGAFELIQQLKEQGLDLALVSMDSPTRLDTIKAMVPQDCFENIVLTDRKTPELFRSMNPEDNYDRVIVVGDRIKSEIVSANRAGHETVWLKTGRFQVDAPSTPDEEPDHVITSLDQLIECIA